MNFAQTLSAVPEIYEAQTKSQTILKDRILLATRVRKKKQIINASVTSDNGRDHRSLASQAAVVIDVASYGHWGTCK